MTETAVVQQLPVTKEATSDGDNLVLPASDPQLGDVECSEEPREELSFITNESHPGQNTDCPCPCCTNFDIAHQPTNLSGSKSKGHQLYSRTIQSSWYARYKWITVCTSSYRVYCHICCSA